MRIAFATSGLEPGCDGVGDHTSGLAAECAKLGHSVVRLALNDRFIKQVECTPVLLRLPSTMSWADRAIKAKAWMSEFAPDFISLQFVAYGFHPRGIFTDAIPALASIFGRTPMEIMFHELWIGGESGASLKHRLIGWLQRRSIHKMLRLLNVRQVHTSNPFYQSILTREGIPANLLPLFGALPLPSTSVTQRPAETSTSQQPLTFVLFGTLHPVWPAEPLFSHLRTLKLQIKLVHVGRVGSGADLWAQLQRQYQDAFEFQKLGELSPQDVADVFAAADFGIATTPWGIIGKSGSVAAMLESGLPVVVNRNDVPITDTEAPVHDSLLILMDDHLPEKIRSAKRQSPRLRLPNIAKQFFEDWLKPGNESSNSTKKVIR